ncbi:Uncharacterised protein [Acetobacterium wieringae]|uniref:hypothetical protein n=1 Tax=Acetobacterium wieringae TaxID=52694 RepID=UPI001D4A382A|nr:hypothetical protein [Acetobacterium wieringae]VUZ28495.1 Uncharacterised protein [Acetobacterium wieringae]
MTPEQIADFEKRFLDKFKDTVSIKHKERVDDPDTLLFSGTGPVRAISGYDVFELGKVDGTVQEIKVG